MPGTSGKGHPMYRIGLTGGMGSGKSEVAALLRELGARVVDADVVARELVARGSAVLEAIVDAFGTDVLAPDGSLDRRALAAAAFSSEDRLAALTAITEPALIDEIVRRVEEIERQETRGVLVVDAALLVQWDVLDMFDAVLVVRARAELRTERLVDAGFAGDDVGRRMRSQLPDEAMLAAADTVIENEGTLEELRAVVEEFWKSLKEHTREDAR